MKLAILLAFAFVVCTYAKLQNVTVKGVAVCNKKRIPNVKVELYDKDTREFSLFSKWLKLS